MARSGMSEARSGPKSAQPTGSLVDRLRRAWRALPHERRLAAGAAVGLFVTLFLPWYQETVIASGTRTNLRSASASLTGWGAFSFVEAAVLLVAAGVLVLLFIRAEGRAFHVPGGDGGVITAAGLWTSLLIVWRIFDKEGTTGHGQYATTSGIEWGILIALGVAVLLAYAGSRIRLAHEPEPPLPGEGPTPRGGVARTAVAAAAAGPGVEAGRVPERPGARRRAPRPETPGAERVRPDDQARPRPRPTNRDEDTRPRRSGSADENTRPRRLGSADEKDTRPRRPRADTDRPMSRELNFSELEEIQFDDPPEAPTIRRSASTDDPARPR